MKLYCPICQHEIIATLVYGVRYWVHDPVDHPEGWCADELEMMAMEAGLQ